MDLTEPARPHRRYRSAPVMVLVVLLLGGAASAGAATAVRRGQDGPAGAAGVGGFKLVNDELGHSAGDALLREMADRLSACLRDGDTVARFGGDEFAVVVEQIADPAEVRVTADRIVAAVQQQIGASMRQVTVTASVGIALNRIGDTADDILREADLAMYLAKSGGKGRHVLAGS